MKATVLLLLLGSLASITGVVYGLCNSVSRPYVISLILITWGIMLYEMKKAPIDRRQPQS